MFTEEKVDQRWTKRKILKVRAQLAMQGGEPSMARTHDICGNGMSVSLPYPLTVGQAGTIRFDLLADGKAKPVTAPVKVVYCIYSSGEFKVGFKFANIDLVMLNAITKFVG